MKPSNKKRGRADDINSRLDIVASHFSFSSPSMASEKEAALAATPSDSPTM